MSLDDLMIELKARGNWGHGGRPGKHGGSAPKSSSGGSIPTVSFQELRRSGEDPNSYLYKAMEQSRSSLGLFKGNWKKSGEGSFEFTNPSDGLHYKIYTKTQRISASNESLARKKNVTSKDLAKASQGGFNLNLELQITDSSGQSIRTPLLGTPKWKDTDDQNKKLQKAKDIINNQAREMFGVEF